MRNPLAIDFGFLGDTMRELGHGEVVDLLINPESASEEIQNLYHSFIQKISDGLLEQDSPKTIREFIEKNEAFKRLILSYDGSIDAEVKNCPNTVVMLNTINKGTLTFKEFENFMEELTTTNIVVGLISHIYSNGQSFCDSVKRINPGFTVKSRDKVKIVGFPQQNNSLEDTFIEAGWLMDFIVQRVLGSIGNTLKESQSGSTATSSTTKQ